MTTPIDPTWVNDERLQVVYRLAADYATASKMAAALCLEQTVEVPLSLIPADPIGAWIIGRIEQFLTKDPNVHEVTISYAAAITALELPQLLNVILGNSSLTPGVRVEDVSLSPSILAALRGPRFGVKGWRQLTQAEKRPILATALKPMGLSVEALTQQAYAMALGGMDIIKDDHGLSNQAFGRYSERVARVGAAVLQANSETAGHTLYLANVTGPVDQIWQRAHVAKQAGASGLLVCPGLVGFDTMRALADDDSLAMPIMAHPSLLGAFVAHPEHGMAHHIVFGLLARLAGADATVFTNYGGRFAFSITECQSIAQACLQPLGDIAPILPTPAGGMTLERIPDLHKTYGIEVIYLIGGALVAHSPDLTANCRHFRHLVAQEIA